MTSPVSTAQSGFEICETATPKANALPLARMAKLAYALDIEPGTPALDRRFPDMKHFHHAFSMFRTFEHGQVEGYIASNATDVIVAIRGYKEADRWFETIPYTQVSGLGGNVSEGMLAGANAIWDDVLSAFFDANVGDKQLWLTGHSVGGAMATVLAAQLDAEGFGVNAVYTYGAPAVFDTAAASAFQPQLHRFENDGDWIPQMQWPRLTSSYVHTGERHLLLRSGAVGSGRYPDHLARRIDRFMNIETPMGYGGAIEDHRMDEYIRRLRLLSRAN